MKITVTTLTDDIVTVDVSSDMEIMNFLALTLMEMNSSIPPEQAALLWNGRPLHDVTKTLNDYGIKENDVLLLQSVQRNPRGQAMDTVTESGTGQGMPVIDFGNVQLPGSSGMGPSTSSNQNQGNYGAIPDDPKSIRDLLLSRPHDLAILKERNPELADALTSGNLEKFTEVLTRQRQEKANKDQERIAMLNADPFDPEVQKKIAEEIRLKNVESNMETAIEFSPESFGQVVMLYIDCRVNGHPVKAFVDSGAQMTIMSQECATRCGIMRLVDTRWAGIAKGVGTQRIIGRVHLGQIQIKEDYLQSSFSILEDQPMDMLLGLDMLKRHQCSIDLKRNRLVIGTTGTETPFLAESEVPDHAKLNRQQSGHEAMEADDKQLAEALARSAQEASSGGASGSSSAAPKQNFPEKDIQTIITNGFTRQEAIRELTLSNGNVDHALAALFAKSIKIPQL